MRFEVEHEQDYIDSAAMELVEWFSARYEDPANSLPYITREGGYQWIYGGPYDATEVLSDSFLDADPKVIEKAVAIIEKDGLFDWSLKPEFEDEYFSQDDDVIFEEDIEQNEDLVKDDISDVEDERYWLNQDAGIQFSFSGDGRVVVNKTFKPEKISSDNEKIKLACFDIATDLAACFSGSNAFPSLEKISKRYADLLSEKSLDINNLYVLGVRLQNIRASTIRSISNGDLPSLSSDQEETLNSVLEIHGVLISSLEKGRELLSRAREYAFDAGNVERYKSISDGFSTAFYGAENLFEKNAIEEIVEVNEQVGSGPIPAMSNDVSRSMITNILKLFSNSIFGGSKFVAASILGGAVAGSSLGVDVSQLLIQKIDYILLFVRDNLPLIKSFLPFVAGDQVWLINMIKKVEEKFLALK